MKVKDQKKLVEVWEELDKTDEVFLVKTDEGCFYVESPDDQGLTVHEVQETLMRVFLNKEEASFYKDVIGGYIGLKASHLVAMGMSLPQLFKAYPNISENTKKEYSCPLRVEICSCEKEEFPEILDTLITNTVVHN